MMTTKRYRVHWLKASRTFVVRNVEGLDVADVETIEEAWQLAEALDREHQRRVEARRAETEAAAAVRAARLRAAQAAARVRRVVA